MRDGDLPDLLKIMQARYQIQQQAFQKLLNEENLIRTELSRIDGQARASEDRTDQQMKAIGADVIWKAWVGRTKRSLNIQLAQILAQKEHHIQQVKRAYGKVLVTEELMNDAKAESQNKAARAALAQAVDLSLIDPDHHR